VVDRLLGDLRTSYDAYAGVSVGALVCAHLAQYKAGEEMQAASDLVELFSPIEDSDIWKSWFLFGRASIWKSSALNSKPLQELVKKALDEDKVLGSGKKLRVGAVSLDTTQYRLFDETYSPLAEAVLASASYPAFFEPVQTDGQLWTDGGIRVVTPIKALIDLGCDEIDVSICHPPKPTAKFERDPDWPDVAIRSIDVMSDQLTWVDVKYARLLNRLLEHEQVEGKRKIKIRVFHPSHVLNENSLHFDPHEAMEMQKKGYEAAKALEEE
jgi:predicted acylesterase/phospholipase RssA